MNLNHTSTASTSSRLQQWVLKQVKHLTGVWVASDQHHWPDNKCKFHQKLAFTKISCWAHDQNGHAPQHNTQPTYLRAKQRVSFISSSIASASNQ
jgi:hypothetical protein